MGILRGGTTVGEKWCPPTWRWATSRLCPPPTKHVLRGWYIVYGGTDTYAGRIPLGWRYTWPPGRTCYYYGGTDTSADSWANTGLSLGGHHAWTAIRSAERYTSVIYLGWLVLLLTWAIHTLVGATFEGDTHLLTITWAIHNLVGATLHTLKLLGDTYLVYRPKRHVYKSPCTLLKRFMLHKGLCQACRVDYHTYVHFNK